MSNLFFSKDRKDFWVWVDPDNWLVRHQITHTGGFTSAGLLAAQGSNLMFIPNPEFRGEVSAYQHGAVRGYMAEYNLEINRAAFFPNYPSRLNATYLFESEEEAMKYATTHHRHVGQRILKPCHSVTIPNFPFSYSVHDTAWVDFLRTNHSVDAQSVDEVAKAFWSGARVVDCQLQSMGEPWTREPIMEVLFIGRIEFEDRSLER